MSNHDLLSVFFLSIMIAICSSNMSRAEHLYGNVNEDQEVDLQDAVLSLQVVSGGVPAETIRKEADVDGDLRLGVAEAVHAMRVAAGFPVVVDSLLDLADPPAGTTTLRAALERARSRSADRVRSEPGRGDDPFVHRGGDPYHAERRGHGDGDDPERSGILSGGVF